MDNSNVSCRYAAVLRHSLVSDNGDLDLPRKLTLMEWIQEAKQSNALVFIAGTVFDILGI
jgi:hypothetical protein